MKWIEVGFFATARYPDGTPVTNVAAWNEFGTNPGGLGLGPTPERPFFRTAIKEMPPELVKILKQHIDPALMVIDRALANRLGIKMQGMIQVSITDGDWEENTYITQVLKTHLTGARKPETTVEDIMELVWAARGGEVEPIGKSTPLVDTGFMVGSVTFRVHKN